MYRRIAYGHCSIAAADLVPDPAQQLCTPWSSSLPHRVCDLDTIARKHVSGSPPLCKCDLCSIGPFLGRFQWLLQWLCYCIPAAVHGMCPSGLDIGVNRLRSLKDNHAENICLGDVRLRLETWKIGQVLYFTYDYCITGDSEAGLYWLASKCSQGGNIEGLVWN
jgi:hypothetical protein